MTRAAFQVLIIPYRIEADGDPRYLLFKRSDLDVWQWIAGGGEGDEQPEQTARREAREEADIPEDARLIRLDSMASIRRHISQTVIFGEPTYTLFLNIVSASKSKTMKFIYPVNTASVRGWTMKRRAVA